MEIHRTSKVFVPGGMPDLTYVPRVERNLEEHLSMARDNLCKLVTVTGATKSGKTVLVRRIFPRDESIWVDGGTVKLEEDLWNCVLDQIGGYTEVTCEESEDTRSTVGGKFEAEAGVPLVAKGKGAITGQYAKQKGLGLRKGLSLSPRSAAISQLRTVDLPLIIDDFHYLDRGLQANVIRALKAPIFEGLPVILIAIPHRRYDAVKVEREMTGRLEAIRIPTWHNDELMQIPNVGFPMLNVDVKENVTERLADEAYGSPHLMQEFCRQLSKQNGIEITQANKFVISEVRDNLFREVAEDTGKVIFDKLAKGPRQRADRIQRKLKSGETADIYLVTLYALAKLRPGLQTIEYEQLRSAIRDILADRIPQAQEVTRVLEKMAEIAASDEASTPVIDLEKKEQKLHITDPFFAFYLKWGIKKPPKRIRLVYRIKRSE